MAVNTIDKVKDELVQRFSKPLDEFHKRRIIFWYDEDRQFEGDIASLTLPNVKIVTLGETNNFALKKELVHDDISSNYLVYCPVKVESKENDWFLNIKLYSEEFRSDMISIWITDMGLTSSQIVRDIVKEYQVFFRRQENRRRIEALNQKKNLLTKQDINLAILASLCRIKNCQPQDIIKAILATGLDQEQNSIYQCMVDNECDKLFWAMANYASGYCGENSNLETLAITLLLSAFTKSAYLHVPPGLDDFVHSHRMQFCYELVEDWLHSHDNETLTKIARFVEERINLQERLTDWDIGELENAQCMPCINAVIAEKLLCKLSNNLIDLNEVIRIVEKRRVTPWFKETECFYEEIMQLVNIKKFYEKHAASFHTVESDQIWREYSNDYFKMDTYYRLYLTAYRKGLQTPYEKLIELSKQVTEHIENTYTNWYLAKLGENWTKSFATLAQSNGKIPGVEQLEDFYKMHVQYADKRVFVIISDAMRYEVAYSLADQLKKENKARVELKAVQGIFPTITKFGMAALLPHNLLTIVPNSDTKQVKILADGQSTDAPNRESILQVFNKDSAVVKAPALVTMKKNERRALLDGKKVIYIYHDTIDAAGHDEKEVFEACEKTIAEIKNIVRIINNDFGSGSIFITADHGFLYNYSPLKEDDKLTKSEINGKCVDVGKRHVISVAGVKSDYLVPVKFMGGKTEYEAFSPREYIRFAVQGGGVQFVHGGCSLQELCVPLIEYNNIKNSNKSAASYEKKPVTVTLITSPHKIFNMMFNLEFYQKEPVDATHTKACYRACFVDSSGKKISDEHKILADRTSDNSEERRFRHTFNLKSGVQQGTYYLEIIGDYEFAVRERIEFQINIPMAIDEFNF